MDWETVVNLFLIVPLLLWISYCIWTRQQPGGKWLDILLISCLVFIIYSHIKRIYSTTKDFVEGKPLNRELGVVVFILACFIFILNLHHLYKN